MFGDRVRYDSLNRSMEDGVKSEAVLLVWMLLVIFVAACGASTSEGEQLRDASDVPIPTDALDDQSALDYGRSGEDVPNYVANDSGGSGGVDLADGPAELPAPTDDCCTGRSQDLPGDSSSMEIGPEQQPELIDGEVLTDVPEWEEIGPETNDGWDSNELETWDQDGQVCQPQCQWKECGPDGCGALCGICGTDEFCSPGGTCMCTEDCLGECCSEDEQCTPLGCCVPQCADMECGPNGCGGYCGGCPPGLACFAGNCTQQSPACDDFNDTPFDGCTDGATTEFLVADFLAFKGGAKATRCPDVVVDSAGTFVVVWDTVSQDSKVRSFARGYTALGEELGPFHQLGLPECHQKAPHAALLPDGGHFVVWRANGLECSEFEADPATVVGAELSIDGEPVAPLAGSWPGVSTLSKIDMISLKDIGTAFLAYSRSEIAYSYDVYVQAQDLKTGGLGEEFKLNAFVEQSQDYPSITQTSDASVVVVWESCPTVGPWSDGQDGDYCGIFGRIMDGASGVWGEPFQVNTTTWRAQERPSVEGLSGGGFVAAWHSMEEQPDFDNGWTRQIRARVFSNDGEPLGSDFLVSPDPEYYQMNVALVRNNSQGGFLAVWEQKAMWPDGMFAEKVRIQGRFFNLQGQPAGGPFFISDEEPGYPYPAADCPVIAGMPGGGYVVAWSAYGYLPEMSWGYFATVLDSAGKKVLLAQEP